MRSSKLQSGAYSRIDGNGPKHQIDWIQACLEQAYSQPGVGTMQEAKKKEGGEAGGVRAPRRRVRLLQPLLVQVGCTKKAAKKEIEAFVIVALQSIFFLPPGILMFGSLHRVDSDDDLITFNPLSMFCPFPLDCLGRIIEFVELPSIVLALSETCRCFRHFLHESLPDCASHVVFEVRPELLSIPRRSNARFPFVRKLHIPLEVGHVCRDLHLRFFSHARSLTLTSARRLTAAALAPLTNLRKLRLECCPKITLPGLQKHCPAMLLENLQSLVVDNSHTLWQVEPTRVCKQGLGGSILSFLPNLTTLALVRTCGSFADAHFQSASFTALRRLELRMVSTHITNVGLEFIAEKCMESKSLRRIFLQKCDVILAQGVIALVKATGMGWTDEQSQDSWEIVVEDCESLGNDGVSEIRRFMNVPESSYWCPEQQVGRLEVLRLLPYREPGGYYVPLRIKNY